MDRRRFLIKSSFYLLGSCLGVNFLSKAFGCNGPAGAFQKKPTIALIIDDIGYSPYLARRFLDLKIPITFSVLPHLPCTQDLAVELRSRGHEIMLHQPMEPYDTQYDPGPGALYVGYNAREINRIMQDNISNVPFAIGVNNHMGSKFTSCQADIQKALRVIKNKGLFFVDSLTSSRSKAYGVAKNLQISTACRNIFLDNVREEPAILGQLEKLKQYAVRFGSAIGIGHPSAETSRAIGIFLSSLEEREISFVHVSKMI